MQAGKVTRGRQDGRKRRQRAARTPPSSPGFCSAGIRFLVAQQAHSERESHVHFAFEACGDDGQERGGQCQLVRRCQDGSTIRTFKTSSTLLCLPSVRLIKAAWGVPPCRHRHLPAGCPVGRALRLSLCPPHTKSSTLTKEDSIYSISHRSV